MALLIIANSYTSILASLQKLNFMTENKCYLLPYVFCKEIGKEIFKKEYFINETK